jgi:hypothetical protein
MTNGTGGRGWPRATNSTMDNYATVTIEELDGSGHAWRTLTSHMVRTNVEASLKVIRDSFYMDRTRIKVDGQIVAEPRRR